MNPDSDTVNWLRVILAFGSVLALMSLLALGLKFLAKQGILVGQIGGSKSKRMHIVEVLPLDTRRRLAIIRRDDREHLLLLGNERDLVIESFPGKESAVPPLQDKEVR